MIYRIFTSASLVALLAACSHETSAPMSPTEAAHDAYLSGNVAAAEQRYSAILNADPNNAAALLGMGEIAEATGGASDAAEYYQRAHAIQSGTIRVWDAGMQDGVTEVAMRRLGALGGHVTHAEPAMMREFEAPAYAAPIHAAPMTYAAEPSYALDDDGVVYYADPGATQPLTEPVYASPEAATGGMTSMHTPVYEAVPASYTSEMIQYEPAPAVYNSAPMQYEPAPIQFEPAPMQYMPAPTHYEPAPVYQPAPTTYAPAPMPMAKPMAHNTSADYTVVNGVVEYNAAPQHTPMPASAESVTYESMPVNLGTPVDVISSGIPALTPNTYSAPRGVDVQNGIPMINLNN